MKRIAAVLAACLFVPLAATSADAAGGTAPRVISSGASTFGGYLFVSQQIGEASSAWEQPAVTCTAADSFASFSVSLGDASDQFAARAGVAALCRDGQPAYFGWLKLPGSPRHHLGRKIQAGDLVSIDLNVSQGPLSVEIIDHTQGWGEVVFTHVKLKSTDAAVGVSERSDGSEHLADFDAAHFTAVRLDGQPVGGQTVLPIKMQTLHGLVKAKPSKLTKQGDFTVTWLHA